MGQIAANTPHSTDNPTGLTRPDFSFPYQLSHPASVWKLDKRLEEVSGLAWMGPQTLACVQDEDGEIFRYTFGAAKATPWIDFGKGGDYEGLAKVGDYFWVVRSDGRLYEIAQNGKKKKYDTPLDKSYNVEGLCYQPSQNRLLLACKGYPGNGTNLRNSKAIYAFDLDSRRLTRAPVYTIARKNLEALVPDNSQNSVGNDLREFFDPDSGNKLFQPSGVAVHPQTGHVYVIAHVGKLLLVLSESGELLHAEKLDHQRLPQPEGICFSPDGDLFLATEGVGSGGQILHFSPK